MGKLQHMLDDGKDVNDKDDEKVAGDMLGELETLMKQPRPSEKPKLRFVL